MKFWTLETFRPPNAAPPPAGVDPEGKLVATQWAESELVSAVTRVGVWKSSSGSRMNSTAAVGDLVGVWRSRSGCRMGSTTAVGDDVLSVSPNNAAEYDRGLGVPRRAAPLGGSQGEPVSASLRRLPVATRWYTVTQDIRGRGKQVCGVVY